MKKRLDWNIDGELEGSDASLEGKSLMDIECQQKYLQIMVPAMAMHKVLFHQGFGRDSHSSKDE